MSVQEYSFKFTKLSKYAPSLVSNPTYEMSLFVTGVSNDFVEECHSAMLHYNMDISRLIVHAQQVEDTRIKRKNRELKKVKSYEGHTSKSRLEIQDKRRFKKRVSNQVPSNFSQDNKYRVSNLKSQRA